MTLPIAHAGHWAAGLLYAAPVLVLVIAAARQRRIEKRRLASEPAAEDRVPDPPA